MNRIPGGLKRPFLPFFREVDLPAPGILCLVFARIRAPIAIHVLKSLIVSLGNWPAGGISGPS
jgi:hypothetical protein